jgi:NAD(P)H-dependent FMN reductase
MAAAEYLVIAASLRPASFSRIMASALVADYTALGAPVELLDLREHPLPLCDGDTAYAHPGLLGLATKIRAARVVVLAVPIYNYDANAAAKNLVELTGKAWEDKIVGFLCAAGGDSSYMSIMSLANSLMLDFRCIILPRFVYATGEHFSKDRVSNRETRQRIRQLAESSLKLRHG